jgi:hypothetical protein
VRSTSRPGLLGMVGVELMLLSCREMGFCLRVIGTPVGSRVYSS